MSIEAKIARILFRMLVTVVLVVLGCWTFYYNWLQRSVRYDRYTYSAEEAERLKNYPRAQYLHGIQAWLRQDPETAAKFFRQAVSQNVLYMDGWLRLAESEMAMGRAGKAQDILTFTVGLTEQVFRWKWPQILLARELGMEKSFYRNTNYLLSHGVLKQDALQLLHTHFGGDASAAVTVLEPEHQSNYLQWLMNWRMTSESLLVWRAMTEAGKPEKELALRYAHFLLQNQRITLSRAIWQECTGLAGITNPGFEAEITRQGFDWRHWGAKDGNWELKRINHDIYEGNYALKITFKGRENISFHHIYQIIAADPRAKYRLTYAWKSRGITSDQGPFVEIYSYDRKGLNTVGPMITGTHGWREESIEFEIPEGCQAAVIRLRRRPSKRFDSKIRGVLWLDDFRLEKIITDVRKFPGALSNPQLLKEENRS